MQHRILIVEDAADAMCLLRQVLERGGYEVVQGYGGEDALRKLKTLRPHMIVTDLAMPKMSGVELIDAVRRDPETQHIPILAVTAYLWDAIARAADEVGCDAVLSKPFNSAELLEAVAKCLERRRRGRSESAA